ncbi:hypothetical protein [Mycobacterium paragordonae]|uniref:hypothetical protein n=1 Tax=Mycobacterium paragordonae TaxID=1389713 RepID=UPI0018CC7364|nr:hypothetical protein [Mycobacterium paragordonae]
MSNVPSPQPPRPAWSTAASPAGSRPSRGLAIVSLVIAFVAIGIAVGAWFRPLPKNEPPRAPSYSSQEVADAKAKVCAAYAKVHSAITASSARDMGTDPIAKLAFALNGRQALLAGSEYLRTTLSHEPATPPGLATKVQTITDVYQELVINYLNGLTDIEMEQTLHAGNEAARSIDDLCQ